MRKRPPRKGNKLVPNYEEYCRRKYGSSDEDGEDGRPTTGLVDRLLGRLTRREDDEK